MIPKKGAHLRVRPDRFQNVGLSYVARQRTPDAPLESPNTALRNSMQSLLHSC